MKPPSLPPTAVWRCPNCGEPGVWKLVTIIKAWQPADIPPDADGRMQPKGAGRIIDEKHGRWRCPNCNSITSEPKYGTKQEVLSGRDTGTRSKRSRKKGSS